MYKEIIKLFSDNANLEQAKKMAAYMKDNFPYLGISKPLRADLEKELIKQVKKEHKIDWDFVFMLWDLPEREYQYLALDYLLALRNSLQKTDIDKIKRLITQKSWWDSVDILAANIIGFMYGKDPELIQSHILSWSASDNIWLVRIAILFQLKYKANTDTELLALIINRNSCNSEFFIAKAIGWALREYSKTNKEWVKVFLETHKLQPLSVREASKYL